MKWSLRVRDGEMHIGQAGRCNVPASKVQNLRRDVGRQHVARRANGLCDVPGLTARAGRQIQHAGTALGDGDTELVRVLGPIPALSRDWRLLAMPEIRKTPRVSAFFDFMAAEVDALKPIITG